MTTRDDVLDVLAALLTAWSNGDDAGLRQLFTPDATTQSSAHSPTSDSAHFAALLAADREESVPLQLASANEYVGGTPGHAVLTSYIYGRDTAPEATATAVFGATLVADLRRDDDRRWRFVDLKLSVPWVDGDRARFSHWSLPGDQGWQLGDATPAIVSEEDSPWARGIPVLADNTVEQNIIDAYYRYAWAIDQGDITLLRGSYTADAHGEFPPMGHRDNRRDIIGQQREFRRHWPWMQHFGRPLSLEVDDSADEARLVIGRVMPQSPRTADDQELFGAHYVLRLRLEDDIWRISYFDYRSGWIVAGVPGNGRA